MPHIPEFKDLKEMAEYWDTHSSSESWDEMEASDDTFKRAEMRELSIRIEPNMLRKVRMLAKRKGLSCNAFIDLLLAEGLERELREAK